MARELTSPALEDVGSLEWLTRTEGRLTRSERAFLLRGMLPMILEGFRLRRRAKSAPRPGAGLEAFEPPDTPIVQAARRYLADHSDATMVNHSYRTAFWTLVVLDQEESLSAQDIETAWVAAMLHDVGLEGAPARGDFSLGGIEVLKQLAHDAHWSEEQTHDAGQAIAVNLSTRVDPARFGRVAWAMNVGGAGELGIWPHRAQMDRDRLATLEARYPRDGFRKFALRLIDDEARRLPNGRFALFKFVYWLLMR